jgi:hypothetical protein
MKVVSLVRAPAKTDGAAFRHWYLDEFAPALLRRQPQISALAVNLVDAAEAVYPTAHGNHSTDVYAEFWIRDGVRLPAAEFSCPAAQEEIYRVEEMVELDRRPRELGRTPGVKVLAGMYPVENVSLAQIRAYWDAHVPLAMRVHVGMNNYIREWIEEPLSGASSPYFGIASLHFPTIEDMRERFFDCPDSIPIHAADLQRFVGSASPLIATRYVLK